MKQPSTSFINLLRAGLEAEKKRDFAAARLSYEKALALDPGHAVLLHQLGSLNYDQGRMNDAAAYFQRALNTGNATPETLRGFGYALTALGHHAQAMQALAQYMPGAAPADTDSAYVYLSAAVRAQAFGPALDFFKTISSNHPRYSDMLPLASDAMIALGTPEAALALIAPASTENPENLTLLSVMGKIYSTLRRFDDALAVHQKTTLLEPENAGYWNNLGVALGNAGRADEALAALAHARALKPAMAETLINIANVHRRRHDLDAAIAALDEALDIDPVNPSFHYAMGTMLTLGGKLKQSWPHLEWRWYCSMPGVKAPTTALLHWHGENLRGKTLLLYADQGVGDTIQFARFINLILERHTPEKIFILCEDKLIPLLQNAFPQPNVQPMNETALTPFFDSISFIAPMCSLGDILELDASELAAPAYLKAVNPRRYRTNDSEIVVGLSWHTKSLDAGYKRSIPLADFEVLASIPNIRLINLQYGDTAAERAAAGFGILHDDSVDSWSSLQDFADQVMGCDLVISIDNSTVHVAGACGVPTWTILPHNPFWRWEMQGDTSHWYPSMRLFRQPAPDDYASVLKTIASELTRLSDGDRAPLVPEAAVATAMPPEKKQPVALLVNDTYSFYHWGCTATSGALRRGLTDRGYTLTTVQHIEIARTSLPAPGIRDFDDPLYLSRYRFANPTLFAKLKAADRVIINGEGTIHGRQDNALRLLYIAYVAKTVFGKTVHIINHACYPQDSMTLSDPAVIAFYLKGYQAADRIVVRDAGSHTLLTQLGLKPVEGFDSLPLAARDWLATEDVTVCDDRLIVLAGSSQFSPDRMAAFFDYMKTMDARGYRFMSLLGARRNPAGDDHDFIAMMKNAPVPVTMEVAPSLDAWFSILRKAALLVSGRFHYTIAAACLGTPFIAFEGNTPKLDTLCARLGEPAPLRYDTADLGKVLIRRTDEAFEKAAGLRTHAKERLNILCALSERNFDGL